MEKKRTKNVEKGTSRIIYLYRRPFSTGLAFVGAKTVEHSLRLGLPCDDSLVLRVGDEIILLFYTLDLRWWLQNKIEFRIRDGEEAKQINKALLSVHIGRFPFDMPWTKSSSSSDSLRPNWNFKLIMNPEFSEYSELGWIGNQTQSRNWASIFWTETARPWTTDLSLIYTITRFPLRWTGNNVKPPPMVA